MKLNIDLNQHGDPHWLSGHGKVNRDAIRRKHRAAHLATRERVINPVRPETRAKLEAALAAHKDRAAQIQAVLDALLEKVRHHGTPHIIRTFFQAINHLDETEPLMRDMIESDLMDVAGINRTKVSDAVNAGNTLAKKIAALRKQHIIRAFRHLRDNLPSDI